MNIKNFFTKYGINTKNIDLYELAFTHSSFNNDAKTHHHDYERLEFVGDSVLGFVVASLIYKHHPEMDEGRMTRTRSSLVKSESLAKKAVDNNYGDYIKFGHSLNKDEILRNQHILEDIFEAVIGAVYLDQGILFAFNFVSLFFEEDIKKIKELENKDYKSVLQEAMQAEHRESVVYKTISEKGPPHDKKFEVEVLFNDQVLGHGYGKSRKNAEQEAAKDALSKVAK